MRLCCLHETYAVRRELILFRNKGYPPLKPEMISVSQVFFGSVIILNERYSRDHGSNRNRGSPAS